MQILMLLLAVANLGNVQPTVVHHDLDVRFDTARHTLSVTAILGVQANQAGDLLLLLNGSFHINAVSCAGRELDYRWAAEPEEPELLRRAGWEADCLEDRLAKLLVIRLPEADEQALNILLQYDGMVYDECETSRFSHTDVADPTTGIICDSGVYLSPDTHWFPSQPGATVRYRMRVSCRFDFDVVSEGDIVSVRTVMPEGRSGEKVTEFSSDLPFHGIHLVAGRYVISKIERSGVDIMTCFFEGSEELSPRYLEASARYISMYEQMLGPYPFGKFAVVENFCPTGYGMPSFTLLGSQVLRLPFIIGTSLGHEVCHNWWGNSVYVDYPSGNWCEGLTVYCADYHYKELEGAEEAAEYRRNTNRDYTNYVSSGADFALRSFTERHDAASRAVGYGKSMMVYHTVRRLIGDEAFYAALRDAAGRHRWSLARWEDIIAAFERAGGRELGWVLGQYVDRPGAPFIRLEGEPTVEEDDLGGYALRFSLRQSEPVYSLQVPVQVDLGDRVVHNRVELNSVSEQYMIRLPARPSGLSIDPDCHLFRRLHRLEIPPVLSQIFGGPEQLIVLPDGGDEALRSACAQAAEDLNRSHRARVKRADQVGDAELASSTLIVLGAPQVNSVSARLAGCIPEDGALSAGRISIAGTEYSGDGLAAVACLRNPENELLGAVVIAADDAQTLATLGSRLLHYGKYSYLVFHAGRNIAKGTWPVRDSPLIWSFD